tara:strand:+ start:1089 stop:1262 length:174 start_codon:yes stop_codon:yes gene_type:complete
MRQSNSNNIRKEKVIARKKYAERQIEKWIKWSINNRGYIKYKEIVEIHEKHNIKCYG